LINFQIKINFLQIYMPKEKKNISKDERDLYFNEAINEALFQSMKKDKSVIIMGLGVDDPKRIFGTTTNLIENFGKNRVFDMPTSENAFTGFAIGASFGKIKPVMVHQRVEFALLSIDQIINQAAKWFYMNDGQMNVPIVIRLIVGRGWGQGPQHSQSLSSMFAHVPGLKVVSPSSPSDAKGLLLSSIEDKNPVIFFEHRWLHSTYGKVSKKYFTEKIGKAKIVKKGKDISLVADSYMTLEIINAAKILKDFNINAEVIDLRSLRPLDEILITQSVKKTKKILVVDSGWTKYGISAEILSIISEKLDHKHILTKRLGVQDTPIPSTRALAQFSYPNAVTIAKKALEMLNVKTINLYQKYNNFIPSDVPNKNFRGPF
tara:strand:- start:1976 stop:3103 length:1128 start_codon:yes stop_codon:yes gene_type:complete